MLGCRELPCGVEILVFDFWISMGNHWNALTADLGCGLMVRGFWNSGKTIEIIAFSGLVDEISVFAVGNLKRYHRNHKFW